MDLAVACYGLTRSFPTEEFFGLTGQMRRAAASIAANIAEGHGRESPGAFVQFLRIAQGSLKETETHITLAARLGYGLKEELNTLLETCESIGKMLRALIRGIQDKK
jgi:four helix bundle protein